MSFSQWFFDIDNTQRAQFWDGRTGTWSKIASFVYLGVALTVLIRFLYKTPSSSTIALHTFGFWVRMKLLAVGTFVSVGPPVWFWLEGRAFDVWVNKKHPIRSGQAALRDTYRINTDQATKFWAAVIALYAAVLLKW